MRSDADLERDQILQRARASARIERLAEAAHDAWLRAKLDRGVISWLNERGIEQMVPYRDLDEDVKEFDRVVVRAMLEVFDQ